MRLKPLVERIEYFDPMVVMQFFKQQDYVVFLDSSIVSSTVGRYSFIALDPFSTLKYNERKVIWNGEHIHVDSVFKFVAEKINSMPMERYQGLPPFQGGVAGLFSYDLARDLEVIPSLAVNDMNYPDMVLGWYDLVIGFDHIEKKSFIFSSGFPEKAAKNRTDRARSRMSRCLEWIDEAKAALPVKALKVEVDEIKSNVSRDAYITAVKKAKNYILEGDIFEVNLSQRFSTKLTSTSDALDVYAELRRVNPAPFSCYAKFEDVVIASSSPERFLKVVDKRVETRPIKGTIKRSKCSIRDAELAKKLASSEKDRAENTMIVDLMRNDFSRVCQPYSVGVSQFCKVESFETVHHLVSVIEGCLELNKGPIDLLQACFPGGSITGAPKIRAMEIIEELETHRRGPYCGSIGYVGFEGSMDTNILIRTLVMKGDAITFQAGGAVVLDSGPEEEYDESMLKSSALMLSLVGGSVHYDLVD